MTHGTRRRWIPLLVIGLLTAAGPIMGQILERGGEAYILPPGSMPSWTVPVLRLVSSTHVEPTTGVIVSDTGLVLVPEDFASMGDEIIVLDGGTDIIRNGRPAKIERKFLAEGLQLLSVQGLKRQGVTLSATTPAEGSQVVLTAFPPAEQIAAGEPPLSIPATIVVFSENGKPAISAETQLPNVTGALVDGCGNLAGISLADDIQSMEHSAATSYQWREALLRVFREMQIPVREFDCSGQAEEQEEEPPPPAEEPVAEETQVIEPEETPVEEEPPVADAEEQPEAEEELVEELAEAPPEETAPEIEILPPIESDDMGMPPEEDRSTGWWWLLAALVLFGLGYFLHRLRKAKGEEPGSAPGDADSSSAPPPPEDEEDPEPSTPRLDSLLFIRGELAGGTEIGDSCEISENAINVIIGRGDADLVIDSPAVSRQHASLNGAGNELMVSDLGSSNGTSINGVPCLEGEIMYIEPGDILVLGDARCTIEITRRQSTGSGED